LICALLSVVVFLITSQFEETARLGPLVVTQKKPLSGNNVSHAQNKTKRRFLPNLHSHRFWIKKEKRYIKLKVSSKGLRIIDKKGIEFVITKIRKNGIKI